MMSSVIIKRATNEFAYMFVKGVPVNDAILIIIGTGPRIAKIQRSNVDEPRFLQTFCFLCIFKTVVLKESKSPYRRHAKQYGRSGPPHGCDIVKTARLTRGQNAVRH
jgi:hypothetical protein